MDLLPYLLKVKQFSVSLNSDQVSASESWSASGRGEVKVENDDCGRIIWRESGCWDASLNKLTFSNTYRWSQKTTRYLSLEHLRYGVENPVFLGDLEALDDHTWQSRAPHICNADSYEVQLQLNDPSLIMRWKIIGPGKKQTSTLCYR